MMRPTREQSMGWLDWADQKNPGPWRKHAETAARAAQRIAEATEMDAELAWHMGLLHDIGRYEGVTAFRHVIAGYRFILGEGFPEIARICLTHSFPYGNVRTEYCGEFDVPDEDIVLAEKALVDANDYDKLIQLCDAISMPEGVCLMEKRLVNVSMRYGFRQNTLEKWRATMQIMEMFNERAGFSIYKLFPEAAAVTFGYA